MFSNIFIKLYLIFQQHSISLKCSFMGNVILKTQIISNVDLPIPTYIQLTELLYTQLFRIYLLVSGQWHQYIDCYSSFS